MRSIVASWKAELMLPMASIYRQLRFTETLKWWVILFVVFFGPLTGAETIAIKPKEDFTVLSWNLCNYNLCDRMVDGRFREGHPKPETEKDAIRKVVLNLRPQVWLVQEIGGMPFIRELADDLRKEGLDYPFLHVEAAEDPDRMLGVLSMVPFRVPGVGDQADAVCGPVLDVKRGLLRVIVDVDGRRLILATFHLKSRFTTDPDDPNGARQREMEARRIRDVLSCDSERYPDAAILAIGDINDHAFSPPYQRFVLRNRSPLFQELPVADSNGETWTYKNLKKRVYEQVDFTFLLSQTADNREWRSTSGIVDGPEVEIASDHRPIFVVFR